MYPYSVETVLVLGLEFLKAMDALLWIKMGICTSWCMYGLQVFDENPNSRQIVTFREFIGLVFVVRAWR